jgi:N-acetylglucosaminyl-diphospho-decaprenol L-rhamnosyltransferase
VDQPLATIIVVSHNSARWLARMSAAIAAQTETRWRLVMVDNASRADERPKLGDLPTPSSLIQSEHNLGFAAGNNLAARDADTPYLVFLNPDAFPEPTWLATLISTAERHPRAVAIGSTQIRADTNLFDGTGDVLHASGIAYRSSYGRPRDGTPPLGETFSACAAAMLVRREAFEAVGGFDEDYFCFFEDVDLGFRLRLRGGQILQSPDAVVAHVGGGSTGARSPFADFHGARNRFWTFVKCMPPPLFPVLLPAHLLASFMVVAWGLLHGRGAPMRGLLAGLASFSKALAWRREVQRTRTATTKQIAEQLAWNPLVVLNRKPVIRKLRD